MPPHVTIDQRLKATRIYAQALPLIAEAVGLEPVVLHNRVLRGLLFKDIAVIERLSEPAHVSPDAGQKGAGGETGVSAASASNDDEERDAEGNSEPQNIPRNIPEPVNPLPEQQVAELRNSSIPPKPKTIRQGSVDELGGAKLVTLYDADSGVYLNMDGSGVTRDRQYIYRGTQQQARAMRDRSSVARSMVFKTFLLPQRART